MRVTRGTSDRYHPLRLLSLGVGLLVAGLVGCGSPQTSSNSAEVLHRGLSGEPATLDPAAAIDTFSSEVMADLYEGLTSESASGEVIPGVASSWTVECERHAVHVSAAPGRPVVQWQTRSCSGLYRRLAARARSDTRLAGRGRFAVDLKRARHHRG